MVHRSGDPRPARGVSAALWGIADFSGGKAAQRAHPLAITLISQLLSLPMLILCLAVVPGVLRLADVICGVVAGVAGFLGIVLLYIMPAARGHLSLVAAIASLYPVSTVLLALTVERERVRPVQVVGLALATAALVLAAV